MQSNPSCSISPALPQGHTSSSTFMFSLFTLRSIWRAPSYTVWGADSTLFYSLQWDSFLNTLIQFLSLTRSEETCVMGSSTMKWLRVEGDRQVAGDLLPSTCSLKVVPFHKSFKVTYCCSSHWDCNNETSEEWDWLEDGAPVGKDRLNQKGGKIKSGKSHPENSWGSLFCWRWNVE